MHNLYLFPYQPIYPKAVIIQVKLALFSWNAAYIYSTAAASLGLPQDTWTPPPASKLTFDRSVNPSSLASGIGGIVRDDKGEMTAAYTTGVAVTHPLAAELQSLLKRHFH